MRPPEEVRLELVGKWLQKATNDLAAASVLSADEGGFPSVVGFHAQQASEKFLKAYLAFHQVEFTKTHDIGLLLDFVSSIDPVLSAQLQDAEKLTPYGVEIRYPGDAPELTLEQSILARELAAKVREEILRNLPPPLGSAP